MAIFKAYDVRGKYPTEIHERFARRLGRAYAEHLGGQGAPGTVAVGHDMRESSPGLARALCEGIHDGGVSTLELDLCTTPTLYFVVGSRGLAGGVMVTASHNPADDNGFKLCREQVKPIGSQSGLKDIEADCATPARPPLARRGASAREDVREAYADHVVRLAGTIGRFKVAFDCGNGVAGPTLEALLRRWTGVSPVRLYFEPMGHFPNHPANPLVPENVADLQRAVKESRCDLGVAFDGDGDRCVFVDGDGLIVSSDLMTALLAQPILEREPGAVIVMDVCSSRVVREEVARLGGVPVEERVGHSFIKKTMRERNAPMAGEQLGHYYWRDHWFADSALIATGRLLALLTTRKQTLAQAMKPLRRTARSPEKNFQVEDKDAALERLVAAFPGAEVARVDGVTLRLGSWWFNARKSNTEPLLRVNAEADDGPTLAAGLNEIEGVLGKPVAH